MPTVRLTIDGMNCEGCAGRVEDGLSAVSGVTTAQADHADGLAKVEITAGQGDADALRDAVDELGYRVTGVTPI